MYDENAPRLVAQGYFPLPISPVDFKPAKAPVKWVPGPNKYVLFAGWNTRLSPCLTPQPGANIGVRCGGGVVAFDFDDEEAALAISDVFDPSPVNKAGQRAWTPFYRADFPVPSEDFFDSEGQKVLQILSDGRQTVIPPSIHPDTNEPYRWTNGRSLYDTPPSELPLLPRDYRERIMVLGYTPKRDAPDETENGFGDNPCADLNNVAIKNLPAWVPELNLYKCRRRVGRFPSYEAVATWRESTTGRALEERALNLKISGRGIMDFGDGRGYSPLDLVTNARSCSLAEGFCWLQEKLLPKKPDIEIDLDKIIEAQEGPTIAPKEPNNLSQNVVGDVPDDSYPEMEKDLEIVGALWSPADPLPEPKPMTVPYFVPSRTEPCIGYIGAITGSAKTFTADDLAVAIASNGLFAGQQVVERGAVVLIEMEGSSRVRLKAAIQYRGIETLHLPIYHSQKMPPVILNKGEITKEWTALKDAILVAGEQAGGEAGLVGYLRNMATTNPSAFLSLLGKVLPMTLAGDRDAPLQERVTVAWEAVDPPKKTD